jgi:hypothetical protein
MSEIKLSLSGYLNHFKRKIPMSNPNVVTNPDIPTLKAQLEEAIALAASGEIVDRRVFAIAFGDARRLRGFSREQLAAETGLSLAHLTRIELGDHAVRPEEAPRLAQVLNLPLGLLECLYPNPAPDLTPLPLPSRETVPA